MAIQFAAQVLPRSSENACSKWHELGLMRSAVEGFLIEEFSATILELADRGLV